MSDQLKRSDREAGDDGLWTGDRSGLPEFRADSLLLGIDTAARTCSAAVSRGDSTLAELTLDTGYTHARSLMGCIKSVLNQAEVRPAELDAVACTVGPGSFTGLRIGLATVKGIALPLGLPLLTVSTLTALAEPWLLLGCPVAALLDARSGRLFAGIYRQKEEGQVEELLAPCQIHCSDLVDRLPEDLLVVGDGAAVLTAYLAEAKAGGGPLTGSGRDRRASVLHSKMSTVVDSRLHSSAVLAAARRQWRDRGTKALTDPALAKVEYLVLSQAERLSGIRVTE